MGEALGIIIFLIIIVLICRRAGQSDNAPEQTAPDTCTTIRCPNCGANASVRGDMWDCGFCGDCGRITRK